MKTHRPRVIIVGGGPGGIACAIWASRLGLRPLLLEASGVLGGQLLTVHSPITDYPGIPDVDGPALAARFVAHLRTTDTEVRHDCRVASIEPTRPRLTIGHGETLDGAAVIIATGARRKRLGLEREAELFGRGVSYSVSKDRDRAAGGDAVMVGGGDSATEGAATLAARCPRVHLVYRTGLSARPDFVAAARACTNVREHPGRRVAALHGASHLEAVELDDGTMLDCASLFIRIGVDPCTEFVDAVLPQDERGFLVVDADQRCCGRTYGVGDVCSPGALAVSVAGGQAMIACKHVQHSWR